MYQFIHVNSYSAQASKKSQSTATAKTIAGEADRDKAYTKHIPEDQVKEPTVIYGMAAGDAAKLAEERGKENKVRKDGHILLAGVISVPSDFQRWDEYKRDCVKYLKDTYGDRLAGVVEHTDEDHPHIHFYCVPRIGERFDVLHDGERVRNTARAERQPTGEQNEAYKQAMKNFQMKFHEKVSKKYGLSKDGPKRERKPRSVYLAERQAAGLEAKTVEQCKEALKNRDTMIKRDTEKGYRAGLEKFAKANDSVISKVKTVVGLVNTGFKKEIETAKNETEAMREKARQAIIMTRDQEATKRLELTESYQSQLSYKDTVLSNKDKEIQRLNAALNQSEKALNERGQALQRASAELSRLRPPAPEPERDMGMDR